MICKSCQGRLIAEVSWEVVSVEQPSAALPPDAQLDFYRTAAADEFDLVIRHRSRKVGVEIKLSPAPKRPKAFLCAPQDLQVDKAFAI